MKKLLTSLVLVLVLCLACGIAFAAQDAVINGESYDTLTFVEHGQNHKVWITDIKADDYVDQPTCTGRGQASFNCPFDVVPPYHVVSIPARGHVWDQTVENIWVGNDAKLWANIDHSKTSDKGMTLTGTIVDRYGKTRKFQYTQDAKDPCLYHIVCDCGATRDFVRHYMSHEKDATTWGKITEKYTCTEGGIAVDYCLKCGKTDAEKTRDIAAQGHSFGVYTIESLPHCVKGDATHEYNIVGGKAVLVCTRCGAKAAAGDKLTNGYVLQAGDLTKDIKYVDYKAVFEDVNFNGLTIGLKSADVKTLDAKFNGEKVDKVKSTEALHDFDGWVVTRAATCTKQGMRTRWCLRCGTSYKEYTSMIAHDFVKRQTLVNCFDAKYDYVCSMCGVNLVEEYDKIVADYDKQISDVDSDKDLTAEEKLSKKGQIAELKKAFLSKYPDKSKLISYEAVKSHEYVESWQYRITRSNTFGLKFEDVYDYNHPFADERSADCERASYYAYACTHFGTNGINGTHSASEGVKYVVVQPALGHDWGAWETVYAPGEGDNVTGYYQRRCLRCGRWQNRHGEDDPVYDTDNNANTFVAKLFKDLLGEDDVEPARIYEWADGLDEGTATAADVIKGFVGSKAFADKFGNDNESIVKALYSALMNRNADYYGLVTWTDKLNNGVSMNSVINGFTTSEEFKKFADEAGFEAGELATESRDVNPRVTAFVERCYTTALDRVGEEGGLNYWTNELLSGAQSPKQVAAGFVFSTEYDAAAKIADEDEVEDPGYEHRALV